MDYKQATIGLWSCLDIFQQQVCFAVITARLTLASCANVALVELLAGTFFGIQNAAIRLSEYYRAFHLVPILPSPSCQLGGVTYEVSFADALLIAQAQGKLLPKPQTCAAYRLGRGDGIGA